MVDFQEVHNYAAALRKLRDIVLSCELEEACKWGVPCYMVNGKNTIILGVFKAYCSINFRNGIVLNDPKGLLLKQGENTHAARLLKFTSLEEVENLEDDIRAFILASKEAKERRMKVPEKKKSALDIPEELVDAFEAEPQLASAWEKLTPGRQRGYIYHFSQAKQSSTRARRIEKFTPHIIKGKGFQER